MSKKPKVAILRTKPETVFEDYKKLLELADIKKYLPLDKEVILKDNISWHFPLPSANTTPWQLEGVTCALKELSYKDVSCVQNRTVVTNAFKGEDLNKYVPIFKEYDIPVLYNFREEDMKWVVYKPKGELIALPEIFKEGIKIPDYFFGKSILHLPTVKCHIYTTTTGAMKNAFGGLLNEKRFYTHSVIHETLVDLLTIQKEIHSGVFAVMDGTSCGNGAGPRIMTPVEKDVIIASADQVAIDAVAASMMGFDPMKLKYIRLAHERGLGTGNPGEIEIVGDVDLAKESWNFHVGKTFHSFLGWLAWFGPTRIFQGLLKTPFVHIANFMSEAYHD